MWIVCWKLHGVCGTGSPCSLPIAYSWVKQLNAVYGDGTHWMAKHANVTSTEV